MLMFFTPSAVAHTLQQDFKTAHLLGVPPSSQLVAMLLGSAASIPLSVAAFLLYTSAWEVPGPVLQAPMAQIWLDMAKLVCVAGVLSSPSALLLKHNWASA